MEPSAKTDEKLIEEAKDGHDNSYRELMKRYISPIYAFARQYAKASEDTDDIVQDAFFKAWKNLNRFKPDKKFRPWLYAITRNTALDYLKKRRSSTFSELDGDDPEIEFVDTLADNEPLPHEDFERAELVKVTDEILEELHPDHRAVIIMHYREDLTFNEIADVMNKPMNTVKSWHRRALGKLKKVMVHRNSQKPRIS